jgi:hypothetical protein
MNQPLSQPLISVLPKLSSNATQFLERTIYRDPHSFTEQKKVVLKNLFIIEYNFTNKLDLFLIMRRVRLVRLFPVTIDVGIDVHVNASYFQAQGVRQLQPVSKFGFHSYHCRKTNFTDVQR